MFFAHGTAKADFNTGRTTTFWGNTDGTATEDQIKAAIQPIADRNFDAAAVRGPPGGGDRHVAVGRNGADGDPRAGRQHHLGAE